MFIWDLDETIIIFHSLLTGTFSSRFGKVTAGSPLIWLFTPMKYKLELITLWQQLISPTNQFEPPSKWNCSLCQWLMLICLRLQHFGYRYLWVPSFSIFTRWLFCLSALLFLFTTHQGCLATPACCGMIDSQQGPLHNRQAADSGWTVVRFLVLARDPCFEFSWSPCGLTQGCARLVGVWERRFCSVQPLAGHACFFFFLF